MKSFKLKALVFSDVHIYHDKTTTAHIVYGLYNALADTEKLRDVDIIFISGDLFDREVFMPNADMSVVINFIYHLLNMCSKYDILLRILEGTPSHDWKQAKLIIDINNNLPNPVDARHVVNLSIEHIERFGIDVLYVPDEWGSGCYDTYQEVKQLLVEHNLETVDLSIMHGCFNFQFPVNLVGKPDVHDEESYLSITKYLIIIGHYHTASSYERIHVPGSFDRLKHGEEEPKGHLEFNLYKDGAHDVKFIENKHAMIFKTFDFANAEVATVVRKLRKYLKNDNKLCYIRLLVNKDDAVYRGLFDLQNSFPLVKFTISLKNKPKDKMVSESKEIIRPPTLSMDNIVDLMHARLLDKHPTVAEECIDALRSVVNNE